MVSVKHKRHSRKNDLIIWKIILPLLVGIIGGVFIGYSTRLKQFEVNIFIAIMLSVCVLVLLLDLRRQIAYCRKKLDK